VYVSKKAVEQKSCGAKMRGKTRLSEPHELCKRAEERIQHQSQLFKDAIESLTHPFYVIDIADYTIKIANSATTIFGEITENTKCYTLTHKRDQPCSGANLSCPLLELRKTKKPVTLEHIHYDKEGHPRHFELHGYPIFDNEGDVVQMIEYTLDITVRKKTEDALQRAHNELESRVRERTKELEKANQALQAEIKERIQTEIKLIEYQQKLRTLASELTLTEEKQRRRIATELHDRIGQALALSKIKLSEIRNAIPHHQYTKELGEIHELLEQTIRDTRTLTFDLSPPILYELGFEAAVEWLAENFQKQHNIEVHFSDDGNAKPLKDEIRTVLFRAVRELLINVAKHSHAKNVVITLEINSGNIRILISDDGKGFDISKTGPYVEKTSGFGLFNIRERLSLLEGQMDIKTKPGQGARVILAAPLKSI